MQRSQPRSHLLTFRCRCVILAAAPAGARWATGRHGFFPLAFRRTVHALLLCNHALAAQRARCLLREAEAALSRSPLLFCVAVCSPGPDAEVEAYKALAQAVQRLRAQAEACTPPLPADALLEIVRCLAAQPLSCWMGR